MSAMELRRISEDAPSNEHDGVMEAADVELLPEQQEPSQVDQHSNAEQMQVEHESSAMQVEESKDNTEHNADPGISQTMSYFIVVVSVV